MYELVRPISKRRMTTIELITYNNGGRVWNLDEVNFVVEHLRWMTMDFPRKRRSAVRCTVNLLPFSNKIMHGTLLHHEIKRAALIWCVIYIELHFVIQIATYNTTQERKEKQYTTIYIHVWHSATLISRGFVAYNSSTLILLAHCFYFALSVWFKHFT